MIPDRSSIEALITGTVFMGEVGAFFPVSMTLRGDEFAAVFMMRASQLGHRTTGPYTPDRPPVDAMNWAQLRTGIGMAGRFPRFRIDASGWWPRIHVELLGTAVRGLIVMPEEVTAESVNAPYLGEWQEQISSTVRIALDWIARWLTACHHQAAWHRAVGRPRSSLSAGRRLRDPPRPGRRAGAGAHPAGAPGP